MKKTVSIICEKKGGEKRVILIPREISIFKNSPILKNKALNLI